VHQFHQLDPKEHFGTASQIKDPTHLAGAHGSRLVRKLMKCANGIDPQKLLLAGQVRFRRPKASRHGFIFLP
jgi:hypothetical protein